MVQIEQIIHANFVPYSRIKFFERGSGKTFLGEKFSLRILSNSRYFMIQKNHCFHYSRKQTKSQL